MIRQFIPALKKNDFNLLFPAYLELFNHPEAHKYLSFTGLPFTEALVSNWFKTHTDAGIEYFTDVSDEGKIRGIAVIKADNTVGFELLGLAVRFSNRQKGVGKGLVRYVMNHAVEYGFSSIDVTVFADNIPMLRLLLGQGFIPVSMSYHCRYDGADTVKLKLYL